MHINCGSDHEDWRKPALRSLTQAVWDQKSLKRCCETITCNWSLQWLQARICHDATSEVEQHVIDTVHLSAILWNILWTAASISAADKADNEHDC